MYIIIAGAGIVGFQVARALVERKHDVVVIDKEIEVCEAVYSEISAMTVHGNATRIKTLMEAGINKADTLLCLMRNDADNIACALLAKSLGIVREDKFRKYMRWADADRILDDAAPLVATSPFPRALIEQTVRDVFIPGD